MSASEKLKALDDLTTYSSGAMNRSEEAAIRGRRLLDVLPEIVAVVEAAEQFNFPAVTGDAWQNLAVALSALEENLR